MRLAARIGSAIGMVACGMSLNSLVQNRKQQQYVRMDDNSTLKATPVNPPNHNPIPRGGLKSRRDEYASIHVSTVDVAYKDSATFNEDLKAILENEKEVSSVWVRVTKENLHLCSWLIENGYEIHHSENNEIFFNKWMRESTLSKIPLYSTHYISCASVLISSDSHILIEQQHGKWGVPVDTTTVGHTLDVVSRRALSRAVTSDKVDYHSILLLREITKTQSGHPDILVAMQFQTDQKSEECKTKENAKWVALDDLPNFLKNQGSFVHYPLHYLILERVWTLHKENLLLDKGKVPYHAYTIPKMKINSVVYPML